MGTHFLWDPIEDNIVKELDDAGNTVADYTTEPHLYGDLISQHRNGQSRFHHYDGVGSTTALTDPTGVITDTYAYLAFGEVIAQTGTTDNPFRYIGQREYFRDALTREYLVRRRPLHPTQGRWLATDPWPFLDNINGYAYSVNCPTTIIDPSGLLCVVCRWRARLTELIDPLDKPLSDTIHRLGINSWAHFHESAIQRLRGEIARARPQSSVVISPALSIEWIKRYSPFPTGIFVDDKLEVVMTYAPFSIEAEVCGDNCMISLLERSVTFKTDPERLHPPRREEEWPLKNLKPVGGASHLATNYMIADILPARERGCRQMIVVTDIPSTVQYTKEKVFMTNVINGTVYITDGNFVNESSSSFFKYQVIVGLKNETPPWSAKRDFFFFGQQKLGDENDCC